MKQMACVKVWSVAACVLLLCALASTLAVADQAHYLYDDLGQISQVVDGQGNVATYTYDAVGNLLAITRNTGNAGASVTVSLTGTNLTGAALATDNPGILVRNILTTPTSLTATFQMSFAARTGATTVPENPLG